MKSKLICNLPSIKEKKKQRNFGIDFARILSMLFIINHHIIYHGGPLFKSNILSGKNNFLLFLNVIFCSGVNTFGMISGYVGFNTHKYSNLIYLLFQTAFYNYGIALYFKKTKPNIVKDLNHFLYPLFISDYWYFNEYFILYFFLPLLNAGIKNLSKREMGTFNLTIFFLFSCFNQISHYLTRLRKDFFHIFNGSTYMWLIILYLFGSYFGRFNNISYYSKFFNYLICFTIINLLAFLRCRIIIYKEEHKSNVDLMRVEYSSPSSVLISLCLIILNCKLDIQNKYLQKIIHLFSTLTFGVYLIHNHVLVRNNIIRNNYAWLLEYFSFKLLIIVIFQSIKIFILCSFIDYLRFLLFKLFKIRQICNFISYLFHKINIIL